MALLLAGVLLVACAPEAARPASGAAVEAPAAVDASVSAAAGSPADAGPLLAPATTAVVTTTVAPPPPPPPLPPPPQRTAFTTSQGAASCRAPGGKSVAFEQAPTDDVLSPAGEAPPVPRADGGRIVDVDVGERPGSSVVWAVETAREIVFGVRVPAYCSGARPRLTSIRVTLPAGPKPIRAVLCDVNPCNFGPGPGPP
jgi:hypothetical protein